MKYLSSYFFSFALIISLTALINWFIDPFGMYWSPQVKNINLVKPVAGTRSRITKAYLVDKIKPEILIVGNSRVQMGIDPGNPIFDGKKVYNQGLAGAHLIQQVDYALNVINAETNLEEIYISVDFLDFLVPAQCCQPPIPPYRFRLKTFDESPITPKLQRTKEQLTLLLSLDALAASAQTIFLQKSNSSTLTNHGFNTASSYVGIINNEGIKPLFLQKLNEISQRFEHKQWLIQTSKEYPYSDRYQQLGRLIAAAQKNKIKLNIFINPYHYSYLHTLADSKQWLNFQLWKKNLVAYVEQTSESTLKVWDFSGFNRYVTEFVPLNKKAEFMKWYWEPAHYRKELGNIMLDVMAKNEEVKKFGVQLSSKNINNILASESADLSSTRQEWESLLSKIKGL